MPKSGVFCRLLTCPFYDLAYAYTPLHPFRPQEAQSQSQGADTAPGTHDITFIEPFELRYARTVIRNYAINQPLFQAVP